MPTRFDIERAVMASKLGPPGKHLMHTLCTRIDADTGVILPRWQPSLSDLARDTSWSRRTVMRWLNRLERDGWVTRSRPSVHDARAKHARTQYLPVIPGSYPHPEGLATVRPRAKDYATRDLGSRSSGARDRVTRKSSESSKSSATAHPSVKELCRKCGQTICICSSEKGLIKS